MLEVYTPHTNPEAVGMWLCSAAKRTSKRSAVVHSILHVVMLENV